MKLRIASKLASVHSEVNIVDEREATRFTTTTDPLSAPQVTRLLNEAGREVARYTTTRTDMKDRAHRVTLATGATFSTTRKFRVSASTSESIITAGGTGWLVFTRRAWSSLFEVRTQDGEVLARGKQVPSLRGDVYDVEIVDEAHIVEMLALSLIARSVIKLDAPSPV